MKSQFTGALAVLFTSLAVFAAGCDDGSGALGAGNSAGTIDCSSVVGCGGVLDGDWRLRGACVLPGTMAWCEGTTADYSQGNIIYHFANGMQSVTGTGTVRFSYPLSCLKMTTCEGLGKMNGNTCSVSGSRCNCTEDLAVLYASPKPVAYTTSQTEIVFKVGMQEYRTPYCIKGDVLRWGNGGTVELTRL